MPQDWDTVSPPPLEELRRRIDAVRAGEQGRDRKGRGADSGEASAHAAAVYSVVDLAAGVAVGAGLGFFLDRALGTKPWLLLLGIILGTASGFLLIYRSVTRASAAAGTQDPEA
jgi:ATP synthase protein I